MLITFSLLKVIFWNKVRGTPWKNAEGWNRLAEGRAWSRCGCDAGTLGARVRPGAISSFWESAWESAPLGESHVLTVQILGIYSIHKQCWESERSVWEPPVLVCQEQGPSSSKGFKESLSLKERGDRACWGQRLLSTREAGARLPELESMAGAGEKHMMPGLGRPRGRLEVQL